jgi:glyoxylase-like metal-dependent hydrolase (beta-lactamase superfamily II)
MPDSFVSSRRFGDAIVTLICEGGTRARLDRLVAQPTDRVRAAMREADEEARVELAFTVAHVRLGATSLLIDAGMGPPRPDSRQWLTPGIEAGLAQIGEDPVAIQYVVITHAHWDHLDGAVVDRDGRLVPRFPSARYLLGRGDWDAAHSGTYVHDLRPHILDALDAADALELVDGDHQLVPGITLLDAPGESPGHHAVLVASGGQSFVHLADLYHHPAELANAWVQEGTDPALCARSRERILGDAFRRDAIVVASHGPMPGWQRVVRAGSGYGVSPAV